MATVLHSTPGQVAAVTTKNAIPAIIKIKGFRPVMSIITNISDGRSVNSQLMQTLLNAVYIYTTGDRIGQLTIDGISFASVCDQSGSSHGIMEVYDFFDSYKVSESKDTIIVSIGDKSITGVLLALNIGVVNPEFNMMTYKFSIASLPEESKLRASSRQTPQTGLTQAQIETKNDPGELSGESHDRRAPQNPGTTANYAKTIKGAESGID